MGGEKKELQPWELKLIGRKDRYTDTWMGWLTNALLSGREQEVDQKVGEMLDGLGRSINPDVNRYELYGKKMDRPWGIGWAPLYGSLELLVSSDMLKSAISTGLKQKMQIPGQLRYVSGPMVAAECFVPSVMQRGKRPAVHFDERYLVEFYNELGIMPDEAAMIGDMFKETIKIKDNNYSDKMWRTHVMPVIISEGYKKELNTVYGILHKEYMDNPAMTREQLEARMDKAQKLLGKLYQEFSVSVANHTEYLEAPLKLLESDEKQALSAEPEQKLTPEEKARFDSCKQNSLVSKDELKNFKKLALKTERPEKQEDLVQAFYRSMSGYVGKETDRFAGYRPQPLTGGKEPEDKLNARCFINAVAALKKYEQTLSGSSRAEELEIASLMKENLADSFRLSENDMNYIMERGTTLENIQDRYHITREVFFGYEPMEVPKPYTWKEEIQNYANSVYEGAVAGAQMISDGWEAVKSTGATIKKVATGNTLDDINVEFTEDDFDGMFGEDKSEEIRQNYQKELRLEEEARQKRIQEEQLRQEEEKRRVEREKEWQRRNEELRKKQEEEERIAKEQEKLYGNLEPWQKKLIGYQTRYSDTWMGRIYQGIQSKYGDDIDKGIDSMFQNLGDAIDPEVKTYEVFGKKLDRPWSRREGVSGFVLSPLVKSKMLSGALKNVVKRSLLTPGVAQYVSGDAVALTCFAPTFIQGEKRPPCHFSRASMVRFYNATGIQPDEQAIVNDMMMETRKIADANYTDEQWRTMLMPQILKGSFKKQLGHVFEMITEDYQKNPAITDKMYRERLEKASNALGEMYCDFSLRLANTTEYLEAPMQFTGNEKGNLFPEDVIESLSKEMKKQVTGLKHHALISESELKNMVNDAASVKRPEETVGSLLEQFYKATSGYIGNNENFPNYVPKPLDVNNRDMENERCLIGALTAAKRVSEMLSGKEAQSKGFFARLFGGRKDTSEEKICLDAMKESLKAYGFSAEKIDSMLKPETTMEEIKQELGIDDKTILGIREKEIPAESDEKNFMDYINDFAEKHEKEIKFVQDVTIGAVNIAVKGTAFVLSKTKDFVYNMWNGGQPGEGSKEEVIAEVNIPQPEPEAKVPEKEEVVEQPEAKEPEKEEVVEQPEIKEPVSETKEPEKEAAPDIDTQLNEVNGSEIDEDVMSEFKESENQEYKNTSYFSWAASAGKSFMGWGNTKPQVMHQLLTQRDNLVDELREKAPNLDKEAVYQGLARMEYFTTLQKALEEDKLTPDSIMKGIAEQRVARDSEKIAATPKFRETCDRMLGTKSFEERINDEVFPEKLHKAMILKNKELKQEQQKEETKSVSPSREDEYDYSFDINL